MKNLFNIILALFTALLVISCRNDGDIPEDIHEHEEIEKMVLTATNKNDPSDVHVVNYIGGKADKHLHLTIGAKYTVNLDFQVKHEDHYHSVNDEIIEEKDEHFVTYNFARSNVSVLRAADDIVRTDGKKLGLKTEFTINSIDEEGTLNIRLVHAPATVDVNYPSKDNQQGMAAGGETDVNATIQMH